MANRIHSSEKMRHDAYINSIKKEIASKEKELEQEESKSIEDYSPSKATCLLNHIECLKFRMKFGRDKKYSDFQILAQ